MAIQIPSPLIEFILLGPMDDRRQLQDSPILGDVWIEFGKRPAEHLDLLITPFRGQHAGAVAVAIHDRLVGDLLLLPSLDDPGAIPTTGRHRVVVAVVKKVFHFRIFDARGRVVVETDEMELMKSAQENGKLKQELGKLKKLLKPLLPLEEVPATEKARVIDAVTALVGHASDEADTTEVAYLQGLVVASLTFEQVLRILVPMTKWWVDEKVMLGGRAVCRLADLTVAEAQKKLAQFLELAKQRLAKTGPIQPRSLAPIDQEQSPHDWFVMLTSLILWAGDQPDVSGTAAVKADDQIASILDQADPADMARRFVELMAAVRLNTPPDPTIYIYQLSLNRKAMPALDRSVPAVKADAARTLFRVDCSKIAWAVLDSGIDGTHHAFGATPDQCRVVKSYNFANFRKIVSLGNARAAIRDKNLKDLLSPASNLKNPPKDPEGDLVRLAEDARNEGPIHWELVERFIEIDPRTQPPAKHGTHVAGILGASRDAATKAAEAAGAPPSADFADGMCPDIKLYDFRVLGTEIKDVEFAIIAALQFIRHLNSRGGRPAIHGANLSLSIPHDIRNYACGRTPICVECERLVEGGVVVVAAAGNTGFQSFQTRDGPYEGYAAFSITDPGNADGVITVGSTHRFWPHTFGVSFFSSRGPTGDGRLKPDLVAPGERIRAPFPKNEWGDLDGTSMAAPHVSGAAAMLMGRYSELIGQPRRIKRILCESATDLSRERSFQGSGMLDVLRAFQSV
jgi:serine protease AprX